MNRSQFRNLVQSRPILLDGATGTELVKRGLPPGAPPEDWALRNPSVIQQLHREYFEAGSDIVLACVFGANRLKLADHNLAHRAAEINARLTEISRATVPEGRYLFGDLSPTGQLVEPFGPLPFEEAVAAYREQAGALAAGGVDGFVIETMLDVQETRAALLACREAAPDLPVLCGMTFEKNGRTLSGACPETVLVTLQSLGADAVGCNCSSGPEEMLPLIERMLPYARVPLFFKPNAGMPHLCDGRECYDMPPEEFAQAALRGIEMGVRIVGGCCGTTPAHIATLRRALAGIAPTAAPRPAEPPRVALTSARETVDLSEREGRSPPLLLVGERINPTGKKAFQAELLSGNFERIHLFAEEQAAAGAAMLDVNLGLGGLDEAKAMRTAIAMLAQATPLPLVVDSVNPDAMEAALRLYPGRALVNSVSGERNRIEGILPIAAKYGAMIIVLPVGEGFMPATAEERMRLVREILAEAEKAGLGRDDVFVDGLAMTVSADPAAGLAALDCIGMCAAEGLRTILGLSNVSFGMPERKWLNGVFLAMGMARGLSAVIANPSAELLNEARVAADALLNRHEGTATYIERFAKATAKPAPGAAAVPATTAAPIRPAVPAATPTAAAPAPSPSDPQTEVAEAAARTVLKGNIKQAAKAAAAALTAGVPAGKLVDAHLTPAIMKAGELFERNEYYLPQLMLAGEAMRLALQVVEPELAKERTAASDRGRIIMATVKGDVHDIGKNLVALMLRNHGFTVHDLGKDVPAEAVIRAAAEQKADIVGLSALMTTTLAAMRQTIQTARAAGVTAKFMVGGAAVTEHFAAEIGADGYSADAVSAVKLANDLMAGRVFFSGTSNYTGCGAKT